MLVYMRSIQELRGKLLCRELGPVRCIGISPLPRHVTETDSPSTQLVVATDRKLGIDIVRKSTFVT